MPDHIPLFEIAWDESDILNAVESIGRGGYWAKGPFVDQFERQLESYLGVEHAIVVNSGTTALVAALRANGVGPGDEVIIPSFTFIATANAVRLVGAEPVFADIETDTYGLDPDDVRTRVTDRTACILPVHVYGTACRIDDILTIADNQNLVLIEDAAEAFGATYEGKHLGTLGHAGVFSFCQNKVITTGEGGAVVTDDHDMATDLRHYRSHGRATGDYFNDSGSGEYVTLGTNIRMSDLTAAVGCAQLDKADELIAGRRAAATQMNDAFAEVSGIQVQGQLPKATHVYQLYTIELAPEVDRSTVIDSLDEKGISSKIYWDTPVHQTQYYRETTDAPPTNLPATEAAVDRVLSVPIYPGLTFSQVDRTVDAVVDAVEGCL